MRSWILTVVLLLSPAATFAQEGEPEKTPGLDPWLMVRAPGKVHCKVKDLKVGYGGQQKIGSMRMGWAVVGETKALWRMEHVNTVYDAMGAKGLVMGLSVRKKDGKVVAAVLGKPGEKGRAIKVNDPGPSRATKPPKAKRVQLTLKSGETLPADHYKGKGWSSWVGVAGETKGVMLKVSMGERMAYELTKVSSKTVKVSKTPIRVTQASYTNGTSTSMTTHPVILALFHGVVKSGVIEVVSVSTTSKPRLAWPAKKEEVPASSGSRADSTPSGSAR